MCDIDYKPHKNFPGCKDCGAKCIRSNHEETVWECGARVVTGRLVDPPVSGWVVEDCPCHARHSNSASIDSRITMQRCGPAPASVSREQYESLIADYQRERRIADLARQALISDGSTHAWRLDALQALQSAILEERHAS